MLKCSDIIYLFSGLIRTAFLISCTQFTLCKSAVGTLSNRHSKNENVSFPKHEIRAAASLKCTVGLQWELMSAFYISEQLCVSQQGSWFQFRSF